MFLSFDVEMVILQITDVIERYVCTLCIYLSMSLFLPVHTCSSVLSLQIQQIARENLHV